MFDSENEVLSLLRLVKDSAEKKARMGSLPARLQWADVDVESACAILNAKGLPKPRITFSWNDGVVEQSLDRAKFQAEREAMERRMQMMQQPQMQPQPQMPMPDIGALVTQAVAQALAAQAAQAPVAEAAAPVAETAES